MTVRVCPVLKSENISTMVTAHGKAHQSAYGRIFSPFRKLWLAENIPIRGSFTASQIVPSVIMVPAVSTGTFSTFVRNIR